MTTPVNHRDKWDIKPFKAIFGVFFVCLALNLVLNFLEYYRNEHFILANPLLCYTLIEFLSIIVSISIFLIAFYTYYQNMDVRLIISGFTFLITGFLEIIHMVTLQLHSYNMQQDAMAQIPLSYIMISRLISAVGFFLLVVVPDKKKNQIKLSYLTAFSTLFILICLFLLSNKSVFAVMVIGSHGFKPMGVALLAGVAILYCYSLYHSVKDYKKSHDPLHKTLACAFVMMFFSQLISMEAISIFDVRSIISNLLKFAAFTLYFNLFYIQNIRRPYVLLSKAKEELNAYTDELDLLVDKRTNEFKQANKRLMADLEIAKGIQRSMLPTNFPQNDFVSFVSGYVPAENLSGDFYNVFKIDETRYGICVGDVSGHGVSAAMLTVFTFQKMQSLMDELGADGMGIPSVVLKHLYDSFNSANFSEELYIVMIYGVYNIDTGIFSYASGGLNTVPLRIRPDGSIQELDSDGYAICKLGEIMKPKFVNHQIMLFPGDKLMLYTDGLVEAVDEKNIPYSKERLKDILTRNRKWNAEHMKDVILEDIGQYSEVVHDDVTFLIMDVLRPF